MDAQHRITKWEEWKLGDRYCWLKGGRILVEKMELVEVNRAGGYVAFKTPSGEISKHFSWPGRWIWIGHVGLDFKAKRDWFGKERIIDMKALAAWIKHVGRGRRLGESCRTCDFYDFGKCFNHHNYVFEEAQSVFEWDWCQWYERPKGLGG